MTPLSLAVALSTAGCYGYGFGHEIQWDSRTQIWAAEASQVRVRNAQSRPFDGVGRTEMLEAVVATFQDLDFQVEVLDPELGIVSGKKLVHRETSDINYLLYDEESLVVFSKSYRTWGPFWRRSDLVRFTVTVRPAAPTRLIVRAAAQYDLRPIEHAKPYQQFFATLEKSLFMEQETSAR